MELRCGHTFCSGCILQWTQSQEGDTPSCPTCRAPITSVVFGKGGAGPWTERYFSAPQSPMAALADVVGNGDIIVTPHARETAEALEDLLCSNVGVLEMDMTRDEARIAVDSFEKTPSVFVIETAVAALGLDIVANQVFVTGTSNDDCSIANEILCRQGGSRSLHRLRISGQEDGVDMGRLDQLLMMLSA